MIRLRVAGGAIASDWVPIRFGKLGDLHAIVEDEHWGGHLQMETSVIVDIRIETEEELMNLHDVIHRLIDRRGAATEEEALVMHDAVEAHLQGKNDSEDVRKAREAQANQGLAQRFEGVSDSELLERAADGDVEAQQERQRRKVLAESAQGPGNPNPPRMAQQPAPAPVQVAEPIEPAGTVPGEETHPAV